MTNGTDLAALIPKVKRARGFRLYDYSGRRFLDLCLDGGRAFIGHRSGRSILMMKNALEKGLAASYPGVWEGRLLKQLKMLYPEITGCSIIYSGGAGKFPVFRPLEYDEPGLNPECRSGLFELLLPLPGSSAFRLICSGSGAEDGLPVSSAVPQYICSGLCRAAADLKSFEESFNKGAWSAFDSPLWTRRGPWLYPSVGRDEYPGLFRAMLKRGILLSPDPNIPSCAPSEFTEGEIKPIKDIEKEFTRS